MMASVYKVKGKVLVKPIKWTANFLLITYFSLHEYITLYRIRVSLTEVKEGLRIG